MAVIIDTREQRSIVFQQLQRMKVPIEVRTLDIGDYIIPCEQGIVCVERKEVNDYVSSLVSGRLYTQLYQMSYNFPISILVVEGFIDEILMYRDIKRQVYISSLAGSLFKRAPDGAQGVINLVCLSTPYDTALFIKYLYEKAENYEPRLPKMKRYKARDDEVLKAVLASLPGVGEKRAEKLLREFGSLKRVISASKSELMKVLGPKTGERLYEYFNKRVR